MQHHRPVTLNGLVSGRETPALVRAVDGERELRFLLAVKRWRDGGRVYDGADYHHIVLRAPRTNLAISYANALPPGTRLHVHGTWRQRDGHPPELVVTRLYQPAAIPAGTPTGAPDALRP